MNEWMNEWMTRLPSAGNKDLHLQWVCPLWMIFFKAWSPYWSHISEGSIFSRCNAAIAVNLQCSEGCSSDSNSSKTRLSGWVIISRRSCLNGWLYLAILIACSRLSSKYLFRKGVILPERRRGLMSGIVSNTCRGSLPFSGVGLLHLFTRLYHPLLLAKSPPLNSNEGQ